MHKSRLGEITIDCQTDDLAKAVRFWEQALGYPAQSFEDHFRMSTPGDEIAINLQRVDHESRVHLDIETDNIDAEVKRLHALGARQTRIARRWVVMTTPTGHGICVCQPARRAFQSMAHQWE